MIKKVSIYDMDGTLVSSLARYKTMIREDGKEVIDLAHWRANSFKAFDDTLLPLAEQYQRELLDKEVYVIIATARVMADEDFRFLREKLGFPDYLISRKENDTTSGGLLKIRGLQKFFNLKNFQDAEFTFFEDNVQYLKDICDFFQIKGVYIPSQQGH